MQIKNTPLKQLSEEWLNNLGTSEGFPNNEASLLAFEEVCYLAEHHPERAWQFILIAIDEFKSNEEKLNQIAASPLEDLLNFHGENIIGLVEKEASNNPVLSNMFCSMYKGKINSEIWNKIQILGNCGNNAN